MVAPWSEAVVASRHREYPRPGSGGGDLHEPAERERGPHVTAHLLARLTEGQIPGPGASLLKLLASEVSYRRDEAAVKVAGNSAAAWDPAEETDRPGVDWLGARIITIGGGTSEMQRNQISERVLLLPRELMPDKDLPFSQVRHN
jgi:alkylation response protein AidB-like acyl-CoA dehydrogenase